MGNQSSDNIETFEVPQKFMCGRLDLFFSSLNLSYSRSYIQKLIKNGNIAVNGKVIKIPKFTVSTNDKVEVKWPKQENFELPKAEDFNFDILYEDDDFLVINKPPGVVVHPAAGNWSGTVVNALIGRDENFTEQFIREEGNEVAQRPGIVHRLDKDTSGCLVVAKNPISKFKLSESFSERKVKKEYSAIAYGHPNKTHFELETLIGRHPINRQKMSIVTRNGKNAITICDLIKKGFVSDIPVSLLNVKILTGRTHQIRVHLAYKKLPIIGDTVYGGRSKLVTMRQLLHARKMEFPHPTTGENFVIECPYPKDFKDFLEQF
ncbi:MAG: RluA family pseudouridine synthase [bacterium]|nr:RluA family pseudouridine synthase [bacterium]